MRTGFTNLFKNTIIFLSYFIVPQIICSILLNVFNVISSNNSNYVWIVFASEAIYMAIICLIYRHNLSEDFKDFIKNGKSYIGTAISWWLCGLVVMAFSNTLISFIIPTGSSNEASVQSLITQYPFYMIFATIMYAPVVEELVFRKSLSDTFKSNWIYIIISGLAFGFVHTLSGLETNFLELLYIIPYGALGAIFAYLYRKTNNVFTTIFIHFLHNGILLFISLMQLFL